MWLRGRETFLKLQHSKQARKRVQAMLVDRAPLSAQLPAPVCTEEWLLHGQEKVLEATVYSMTLASLFFLKRSFSFILFQLLMTQAGDTLQHF